MSISASKGIALVTGAGQGIGRAIALRLADDFDVAVNDIPSNVQALDSVVAEITTKGRRSIPVLADVSVEEQVKNMIDTVVAQLGGLDVMVANAGIYKEGSVLDCTTEDFDSLFAVNVRGTFFCYKYAGLQMVSQGRGGRIIGASSLTGKKGAALCVGYSATKFAIRGLTQSAASDLGKHGITVNAYSPGAIDTPLLQKNDADWAETKGKQKGDFYKMMSAMTPVGYVGAPQDIANLVGFIASKEAHFITGQSISCDGGWYFD